MIKRYICLALTLTLFSCPAPQDTTETDMVPNQLPLASHFSETYAEDLDELTKRHYIRVLTTFSKTGYYLSDGKPSGHEYSLLKEYETYLNKDVKKGALKTVIEFIPCARDELIPRLLNDRGDIVAAALTITPGRSAMADFTLPYLSGINEVLITHNTVPEEFDTLEDLSGKRIYVRRSSSYYESLLSLNETLKQLNKRPVNIIPADESLETEDILEIVNTGVEKITICDSHIAERWLPEFSHLKIHDSIILRNDLEIAWMVKKNNPLLKESLNTFILSHKKGTRLGNIYFQRYFSKTPSAPPPFKWKNDTLVNEYLVHIKKYSKQYDIDPNIVMAVAYCESGFDNTKRNRSGATGIMQIKPQTAGDKNIGIPDISSPENNIHAGVKYLAFLRSHYFDSDDISEKNKIRFSVAAYNAGPAKINRARKLAVDMGFNRDKWFRHVELATLKSIGRETVNYVSNVNKYSIMYSLADKTLENRSKVKTTIIK